MTMKKILLSTAVLLALLSGCQKQESPEVSAPSLKESLIARGKSLALDTVYKLPPGEPLSHYTSGYAKIMCSAVFITGLSPEFAAENVGYFTSPPAQRKNVETPVIDYVNKKVSIKMPNGVTRTAIYTGGQGCVTLPEGSDEIYFKPEVVKPNLPDADKTPWPMGDQLTGSLPEGIDAALLDSAVSAAFGDPAGMTAAFVVSYKGQLIAERYADGITYKTPLESWSMGKSLSATIMGILIQDGVYQLHQPAPIPEWQDGNNPKAKIKISDLLNMSSGLMCPGPADPDFDISRGYPIHWYLYTGGVNSFQYAAGLPQQWEPGVVGRYRNSDPVLINYLNRLGAEKTGSNYHAFPQRRLFDKVGVRTMVMETDPYGNFLTQGYEFASGRDWVRLGNLYLQDGMWNGERILPEGYAKFVSTLAPGWKADNNPVYGGFFWLNGAEEFPIPKEAYYMAGAGGQYTFIIPSHDLVVTRLGHFKGSDPGEVAFKKALAYLMKAVPGKSL